MATAFVLPVPGEFVATVKVEVPGEIAFIPGSRSSLSKPFHDQTRSALFRLLNNNPFRQPNVNCVENPAPWCLPNPFKCFGLRWNTLSLRLYLRQE